MNAFRICNRCVMDSSDRHIVFEDDGVCNYCHESLPILQKYLYTKRSEKENLERLANKIKKGSTGEYDSIIGLSGGVDSSYVAYLAWKMGLNPLCVHFDNGWNSEIAVSNIKSIIETCGFDLSTYVIDWPEFRDLQRAFIRAGVIDIEMLTDHAIYAALFRIRRKYRIRYVLSGTNYATEHAMPKDWSWAKQDLRNIKAIQNRFGEKKIKSFPTMNSIRWLLIRFLGLGGTFVEPLNKIRYRKLDAMKNLENEIGWRYYGGKHYESVFTKFYQAYILPEKFAVDKRKTHWSALIRNGEISRNDALLELKKPLYDPIDLQRDKEFVLKKLGFSETEFDSMMQEKPRRHDEFPTDRVYMDPVLNLGKFIFKVLRGAA